MPTTNGASKSRTSIRWRAKYEPEDIELVDTWIKERMRHVERRRQGSGVGIGNQSRVLKSKRTAPIRWLETMVDAEGKESRTEA